MTKQRRNKSSILWGLGSLLVLLIVLVVFVYLSGRVKSPDRYDYVGKNGNFHIEKERIFGVDIYYTHIFSNGMEYIYAFRNHPKDLEDIYLEQDLDQKLNRPNGIRTIYVTRPLDLGNKTNYFDIVATASLIQILGSGEVSLYKLNLINAYTVYIEPDVAKATCSDVDNETAVIWVGLTESTRVISSYDCIIIEGKNTEELIKAAEKFAYYLLGVF